MTVSNSKILITLLFDKICQSLDHHKCICSIHCVNKDLYKMYNKNLMMTHSEHKM